MSATQTIPVAGQGPSSAGRGTPAQASNPVQASAPANGRDQAPAAAAMRAATTAMVPVDAAQFEEPTQHIDEEPLNMSPMVARLPVELDVMVAVRDFRVRNLLALEPGRLIESQWAHG